MDPEPRSFSEQGAFHSVALTSTGELVLKQHQVDGTRAASGPVPLHDADVGAAAVIPGARMFTCRNRSGESEKRELTFPYNIYDIWVIQLEPDDMWEG